MSARTAKWGVLTDVIQKQIKSHLEISVGAEPGSCPPCPNKTPVIRSRMTVSMTASAIHAIYASGPAFSSIAARSHDWLPAIGWAERKLSGQAVLCRVPVQPTGEYSRRFVLPVRIQILRSSLSTRGVDGEEDQPPLRRVQPPLKKNPASLTV